MIVLAICENSEKNEVTVKCSGEHYLITRADFFDIGINEGDFLSEEKIEAIERAALKLSCIKSAFSMLSYNDMSSGKLTRKLCAKYDKDLVLEVVNLMSDRGYLNDTALAIRYAESFYAFKRWGPARIKSELYTRGFSSCDINEALATVEDNDHSENIRHLLESKYTKAQLEDKAVARKAAAYLYRQGYDSSDIYEVINLIFQE